MVNNINTILVYKLNESLWTVFGLKSENSTRYIKLWLGVDKIPYGCTPVQVIESYNYLIGIHRRETGKRKKYSESGDR